MKIDSHILDTKTFYKVVAIVAALIMWASIGQSENPIEEKLYDVPISYINLPADMAINDAPEYVEVRVKALRSVLDELQASSITASVDLSEANIGQYVGRVTIELPESVELSSVSSLDIITQIQKLETKQIAVTIYMDDNTVADGYTMYQPVITPTEVMLSGPSSKIEAAEQAFIIVDVEGMTESYTGTLPIYVATADGESLNQYITVSPVNAEVFIPIVTTTASSVFAINVPIVGEVADGYAISLVAKSTQLVQAFGDYIDLANTDYVYTESVDVTGISADTSYKVALIAPDGLEIVSSASIDVVVVVEKLETVIVDNLTINIKNTGEYEYTSDMASIQLVVSGAESVITNYSLADFSCNVDVSGLGVGTYELPVNIVMPDDLTLISPIAQTVKITIMEQGEPTTFAE